MKKKLGTLVSLLVLASLALAACAGAEPPHAIDSVSFPVGGDPLHTIRAEIYSDSSIQMEEWGPTGNGKYIVSLSKGGQCPITSLTAWAALNCRQLGGYMVWTEGEVDGTFSVHYSTPGE